MHIKLSQKTGRYNNMVVLQGVCKVGLFLEPILEPEWALSQ